MTKTSCPICKEMISAKGFYDAHHKIRSHLLMKHPNEMCDLQQAELKARQRYNADMDELYKKYGLAVRPINMNL